MHGSADRESGGCVIGLNTQLDLDAGPQGLHELRSHAGPPALGTAARLESVCADWLAVEDMGALRAKRRHGGRGSKVTAATFVTRPVK